MLGTRRILHAFTPHNLPRIPPPRRAASASASNRAHNPRASPSLNAGSYPQARPSLMLTATHDPRASTSYKLPRILSSPSSPTLSLAIRRVLATTVGDQLHPISWTLALHSRPVCNASPRWHQHPRLASSPVCPRQRSYQRPCHGSARPRMFPPLADATRAPLSSICIYDNELPRVQYVFTITSSSVIYTGAGRTHLHMLATSPSISYDEPYHCLPSCRPTNVIPHPPTMHQLPPMQCPDGAASSSVSVVSTPLCTLHIPYPMHTSCLISFAHTPPTSSSRQHQ